MNDETNTLPAGFERADTDVDDFPAWDFDEHGLLQGTVIKIKTTERLTRGEYRQARLAVIRKEDAELVILWESANLSNFFDAISVDNEIYVQPAGEHDFGDGRKMRLYNAFFK